MTNTLASINGLPNIQRAYHKRQDLKAPLRTPVPQRWTRPGRSVSPLHGIRSILRSVDGWPLALAKTKAVPPWLSESCQTTSCWAPARMTIGTQAHDSTFPVPERKRKDASDMRGNYCEMIHHHDYATRRHTSGWRAERTRIVVYATSSMSVMVRSKQRPTR